ncbi:hypothetical protein COV13_02075 [Candidatus Woesearchaeota archaeon CG10_big_fil_rev_8_21_14_0_10_32_9]|nr:MAG: hypothetical protein COV13_02075 [Candidatus Woesearchaeota archaeon CG10_big_fil_rev_8_21_14_0_10_32_9]
MIEYFLYFLVGGTIVTASVILAQIGHPLLAGVLMFLPNMSLVGFYFINKTSGSTAVLTTVKSSLLGTIFIWPIYMLALLYFIPKFGVNKALLISLGIVLVFALIFVLVCKYTPLSIWLK